MFQGWQKCIRDHPLTPGGRGGNRGSLGVSKSNFIKSKSFANKSCQVCFKGDKNSFRVTFWPLGAPGGAWGCQNQISSSQKVSLTKVVRYVSGVKKNQSGSPSDSWGSRPKKFHQIKKFHYQKLWDMFQGSQKPARPLPDLVPSSCALAPRQTREAGFLVLYY